MRNTPSPRSVLAAPLDRAALNDVIELALWAGQLLMQNGAGSERIERTISEMGMALGCDKVDVFVSANALVVTFNSGDDFRTRIRRTEAKWVNMTIVSALSHLRHRVARGELNRFQVRSELERISRAPQHYHRWLEIGMIGLACASFCRLFGGDWAVCAVTFLAAATAMFVRQELIRRHLHMLLVVVATAFVAGLIASSATWLQLGAHPELALSASVLLLVPGVPMINALEDLIKGHPMVGIARGARAALIALAIALGLVLAMSITGVSGL